MSNEQELQRYLRDMPFKVRRKLAAAIKTEADRLAAAIKQRAPRRTGALAESVQVRRKRNELELEVTAGGDLTTREVRAGSGEPYDYSLAVEFGTAPHGGGPGAQPFFYSTYRAMRADIERNIEQAVKDAINE